MREPHDWSRPTEMREVRSKARSRLGSLQNVALLAPSARGEGDSRGQTLLRRGPAPATRRRRCVGLAKLRRSTRVLTSCQGGGVGLIQAKPSR